MRQRIANALVALLWPALEPLIAAVVAELVAAALKEQAPAAPEPRKYIGGRR